MKGTAGIRNLIRKNQVSQIRTYIETGTKDGMRTMDQDLERLVLEGKVKIDIAAEKAYSIEDFYNKFGDEEEIKAIRRKEDENLQAGGTKPNSYSAGAYNPSLGAGGASQGIQQPNPYGAQLGAPKPPQPVLGQNPDTPFRRES